MMTAKGYVAQQVLLDANNGIQVIPSVTPLTALNYFDGKFLRAEDLTREEDYLRALIKISNGAGGSGLVHGFDVDLVEGADAFSVSPGLAIDGAGNVLLMPARTELTLSKLLASSANTPTASGLTGDFVACAPEPKSATPGQAPPGVYLLTVGYAEGRCGTEDVFGKLCDQACATSENQRFRIDGVRFRAVPISLDTTPWFGGNVIANEAKYQRSALASAFYAADSRRVASLIHGKGLHAQTWCLGAAGSANGDVPVALFMRSSGTVVFIDAWTARRERVETPPRRYWDARMAMRPWADFLAQVLQFQCQLAELISGVTPPTILDACANERRALEAAIALLTSVQQTYARSVKLLNENDIRPPFTVAELDAVRGSIGAIAKPSSKPTDAGWLLKNGIVELPPAGYLPIDDKSPLSVNEQVRQFVDDSLDLRFCIVRPDYVPHALEMRQHMDRISLLEGLAHPDAKPEVDILVPNGRLITSPKLTLGREFRLAVDTTLLPIGRFARESENKLNTLAHVAARQLLGGAARLTTVAKGAASGFELALAVSSGGDRGAASKLAEADDESPVVKKRNAVEQPQIVTGLDAGLHATLSIDVDPFSTAVGDVVAVNGNFDASINGKALIEGMVSAQLDVTNVHDELDNRTVEGTLRGVFGTTTVPDESPDQGGKFSLSVKLQRRSETPTTILFEAGPATSDEQIQLAWNLKSSAGTVSLIAQDKKGETHKKPILQYTEQGGVLETSNEWNDDVVAALNAIERLVLERDPTWRKRANAKLWPIVRNSDELNVLATLDWVLFCRRRSIECGTDAPPAVPKRFQVWAVNIDQRDWNEKTKQIVLTKSLTFEALDLGMVDFNGYELRSPLAALAKWKESISSQADQILWAGVGMKANADTDAVQLNRVSSYEQALAPTGVLISAEREVLVPLPPSYSTPGADGSIVLVVRKQPAKVVEVKIVKAKIFFDDRPQAKLAELIQSKSLGVHDFDGSLLTKPPKKDAIKTGAELGKAVEGLAPSIKAIKVFIPNGGLSEDEAKGMGTILAKVFHLSAEVTVLRDNKKLFDQQGVDAVVGLIAGAG